MWKPFIDSENLYMLRLEQGGNGLTLLLTEFLFVWETQFSTEMLVLNFKENNPLIEATDSHVQTDLFKIIDNLQNVKVSVSNINESLVELMLERSCSEFSEHAKSHNIVYKFSLNKKNEDERQQKMLLNLVQKKDRELEEYRMEKGDISRGDLKTDKFNSDSLNIDSDKMFLNVFTNKDSEDFWKKFTEKNGEVHTTNLSVEAEPWNARKRRKVILSSKTVVKKGAGITYKK